jgi:hypothetical protein
MAELELAGVSSIAAPDPLKLPYLFLPARVIP